MFLTLYRGQRSRPSPRKRNAKRQKVSNWYNPPLSLLEELWTEVHDTEQEAVIKTIPKKKKCKKAKWLFEEDLQTTERRREAKGTGERE